MSNQPNSGPAIQQENIHICEEAELVERASRARHPTDIVLAPEQFHRGNLKRAIADAQQPRSSLALLTPATVASEIVSPESGTDPTVLDRTDRLRLLAEILDAQSDDVLRLCQVFGTSLTTQLEQIEAARAELSLLTGYQPSRLSAFERVCTEIDTVARLDALDLLTGISSLEEHLRNRVDAYVSPEAVLETGCEVLRDSGGDIWQDHYPAVERVNVVGVSTLGTPLLDFLAALGRETTVTVHLYLRAYTGPRIANRLQSRIEGTPASGSSSPAPISRPQIAEFVTTPTTEIVAETRAEEARAALAVCDGLLEDGVSVSDIALVGRDIDQYERPLTRASSAYGHHLSFWTQLDLKRTLPYRVAASACSLLAARSDGTVDAETLFRPVECHWLPPDAQDGHGQPPSLFTASELSELRREIGPEYSGSLDEWRDTCATAVLDPSIQARFESYLEWCESQPREPEPDDVLSELNPLIETFEEVVLPGIEQRDTAAYTETSRAARAVQRVAGDDESEHLLRETRAKYRDWRDRHQVAASWETVRDILDTIATARPGRREHDNAERIDVLDATDTWLRSYPFVIALGFVDGEWPQQPHGAFPVEARTAVAHGDSPEARSLAVRGAWTERREYDHAVDAIRTATNHLIVTRYTEDVEGVSYQRSPLLDELSPTQLSDDTYHHLCGPDTTLPARIRRSIPSDDIGQAEAIR
jgi:ATP-dependent helicase/nuclease subunit B